MNTKQEVEMLQSFESSFTSRALEFLSAVNDFTLKTNVEQFQLLELIIDRATCERRKLCSNDDSDAEALEQCERLDDILVSAFLLAASQVNRLEQVEPDIDTHRLVQGCEQVVHMLWVTGAHKKPIDQRLLWQELLCHRWDEVAATLALEMLLELGYSNSDQVDLVETDAILQMVSFAYPQFPVALKKFCLDQVTALVRTFADEGPTYLLTPQMMVQLQLLEYLAAIRFLDDLDDLDVTQWIDEYFPECFECCGVVLQLLNEKIDGKKDKDRVGMIRMLDMCLLVFKVVLDYFETRRDDICTLLRILTPTIISALSQLTSRCTICAEDIASEISEARSLESSLYLLVRMVAVIDECRCDAIIKIFEKLLAPTTAFFFHTARPTVLSMCFDAVHEIFAHSNIAEVMGPPLAAALQVDNLKALQAQYWMKKHATKAVYHGTCICFVKTQLHSESCTDSEFVAGLLPGIDLSNAKDLTKFSLVVTSGQQSASVLRPDAPQWFGEENSNSDSSEPDLDVQLQTKNGSRQVKKPVPQWFHAGDEEEDSEDPEMTTLLVSSMLPESGACAFDSVEDVVGEIESTSTEIISWSDCSRRPSEHR